MLTYDELVKDKYTKLAFDFIDFLLKHSEKAAPFLPDSIKEIIESGLGRVRGWFYFYYLPLEKYDELKREFLHGKRLNRRSQRVLGEAYFLWGPTSSRESFEKAKERLSKYKSLEEVVENEAEIPGE